MVPEFAFSAMEIISTLVRTAKEILELRSQTHSLFADEELGDHLNNLTDRMAFRANALKSLTAEIRSQLEKAGYALDMEVSINPSFKTNWLQRQRLGRLHKDMALLKQDILAVADETFDLLSCIAGVRSRKELLPESSSVTDSIEKIADEINQAVFSGNPTNFGDLLGLTDKFLDTFVEALKP